MQDYVAGGGRYLGFCLGAFLAGDDPGFALLPSGVDTDAEIDQHGAQVTSEKKYSSLRRINVHVLCIGAREI